MLLCCALLCMTLLLFCGSALAAVDVQNTGSNVTVTKSADETRFTVHKDGVTAGQFYLLMIQRGDASALPTSENLYYLNVYTASGTTFEETAYPKDLTEGTYTVFLSDYATDASNGARSQVATLSVGNSGGGGGSSSGGGGGSSGPANPGTHARGDVDGRTGIDVNDAIYILKYLANMDGYTLTDADDVDGRAGIDVNDAIYILKYLANMDGYTL